MVPIMFILLRAAFADVGDKPLNTVGRSKEFSALYFTLCFTDMLLSGTAVRTLCVKTNQLPNSSTVRFLLYEKARRMIRQTQTPTCFHRPCKAYDFQNLY